MIRTLLAIWTVALLAIDASACGAAHKSMSPAVGAGSFTPSIGSLPGDQDRDNPGGGHYDSDDGSIRYGGHAADAADAQALAALLTRYYAAAAAGDGASACRLTYYIDVETLPEQYGQPPGPRWLRGSSTCPALLTRVFKHFHSQLSVPVVVTGVRVSGDRAEVLVGFKTLPAGVVKARREGRSWKIDGLLAAPLP